MSCCTCCCFYPKYKRKVDSIYPRNPESNLVKNEIDKLQYYSCQHPEKLSKIGDYLHQNLKWGLNGRYKNKNYVKNTMEAVDKILIVIGHESINFFATSYLKMIQKLLEQTEDLDYQKMATNSFKKFCDKESNQTTNYNRNYDQFVCQFSAMCYNNNKDLNIRSEIRVSGLQGIGAMVKKLQPDESLQATYLWDNMDKIIQSLLFIMQESFNERSLSAHVNQILLQKQQTSITSPSVSQLTQPEGDLMCKLGAINDDSTINTTTNTNNNNNNNTTLMLDRIKVQVNNQNNNDKEENIEMKLLSNHENLGGATSLAKSPPQLHETESYNRIQQLHQQQQQQQILDPSVEATLLLKEISTKSDYITITRMVRPLLLYMDDNKGWQQLDFIDCVFKTVMYNVKQQHAIVIKELIKHLDSHRNSEANMKRYVIKAISICIQISALHSIGTTANIIDIFTNLLKHLNFSLEKSLNINSSNNNNNTNDKTVQYEQEIKFQNEILEAMKDFTSQLPDYAKNDVITFITRQINSHQYTYSELQQQQQQQQQQLDKRVSKEQLNEQMRYKYLDALYEICTKYKPIQVFGAFTSVSFLEDILRLTIMFDPQSRSKSNEILQFLLDKYNLLNRIKQFQKQLNQQKITNKSESFYSLLDLLDYDLKPTKEDIHFMRKHGRLFLSHLNESLFIKSNSTQNYESIFITVLLFLVGINDKEFLVDLISFGLHIQYLTLINYKELNFNFKCEIMCFLTAYFELITKLNSNIHLFNEYIDQVISIRRTKNYFKYLYPNYVYFQNNLKYKSISSSLNSLDKSKNLNENDFNKEFDEIAKEFIEINTNQQKKQVDTKIVTDSISIASKTNDKNDSSIDSANDDDNDDDDIDEGVDDELNTKTQKKSNWLFDKKTIIGLLHKSGISASRINQSLSTEFSLSTTYLNSNILSDSYLKYRSINNLTNINLINSESGSNINLNKYNSGSKSSLIKGKGSYNNMLTHINGHDSLDTSYESLSQISETDNHENKIQMFIGNSPREIDTQSQHQLSIIQNLLKQSTNNNNNNILSFDTIKRYFLNNTNNNQNTNIPTSNSTNVLNSNHNYSTISSSNNNNNNSGLIFQNSNELYNSLNREYSGLDDNEDRTKIINEFKQKSFDEIKNDLNKINQQNDKYKQVLEFISKEVHSTSDIQLFPSSSSSSSSISPQTILSKLEKSPFAQLHHHHHQQQPQKQQQQQQKQLVPLNDIEFPHLFMY